MRQKVKTQNIEEQFNIVAKEYDVNRKKFIPCFEDFYNNTTKFIASNITYPNTIVDLGAGTGLLSYYWYEHFTKARYILVDIAEEMLKVAKERFANLENFSYIVEDYSGSLPKRIAMSLFLRCRYIIWKTIAKRSCLKAFMTDCLTAEYLLTMTNFAQATKL